MKRVFVIGGAAVDITGKPESICRLRDSNLGVVRIQPGGVGKNIAKRLATYPLSVELITAIGEGYHAALIRQDCEASGVSLAHTYSCGEHTGTFLCVLDEDGDLLTGISDMQILRHITPAYLAPMLPMINDAAMAVLDGNLPPETLEFLTKNLEIPIFFDPVSCAKAQRIGDNIGRCYAIKPNRFEAAFLSGKSCDTIRGVYRASDWFLEQGVQRVFISLGEEGVFWSDANGNGVIKSACTNVVDTTGAGDAMCAAIIAGCIDGLSTEQCASVGNEAGSRVCMKNCIME